MNRIYTAIKVHSSAAMWILRELMTKSVWLWNSCFALVCGLYGNIRLINVEMLKIPISFRKSMGINCEMRGLIILTN